MSLRFLAQVTLRTLVVAQQPQHAALDLMQQPHPDTEHVRCDLPAVIEAAEDKARLRQSGLLPSWRQLRNPPFAVVDLIAIRQVDDLISVERLMLEGRYRLVSNDVVKLARAQRSWRAGIIHLNRRGTQSENLRSCIFRKPHQIN